MNKLDALSITGEMTMLAACELPENAVIGVDAKGTVEFIEGKAALNEAPPWMKDAVRRFGHLIVVEEPNGFVTAGLDTMMNLLWGVNGPPSKIQTLIVAKSAAAVAATDTSILGGATAPVFTGATQNAFSKVMATPTPVASVAGVVSGGMTFTETDITGTTNFWPMNRLGLTNVAAATNLGLVDVIGNTASQADPYSRTFSIDFLNAGSFTLNPKITLTGVRRVADFPVL